MAKRIPQRDRIPEVPMRKKEMRRLHGVDLTSGESNVSEQRSPYAPNMMPSADGYPIKRPGYQTILQLAGCVFGAYSLLKAGREYHLIHAGTKLYRIDKTPKSEEQAVEIYADMAQAPSTGVQLSEKLWILDGKTYLVFDGETVQPVSNIATVPKITIAKAPNGKDGATSYLPVNLLTGKRTDSFAGLEATAKETVYFLSFNALTDTKVTAEILQADGTWKPMQEGAGFTVNRPLGKVTFDVAPGKSPVDGEDNVRITYECAGKAEKVNRCRFSILYGVNGALDRIFMSGSPDEVNVDYWSEWRDPAYIGDLSYSLLGQESSEIIGYSVLGDALVTHKKNEENGRNAFVRRGELEKDGIAVFRIVNVIQGEGAASMRAFASLNSEPLFLTQSGVYALTPSDVTGERYAQERSYYIQSALKRLREPETACAAVWNRFYVLSAGGTLYLLDGAQKSYESRNPYSTYQYECYYWPNINASCLWVQDGALRFGTADGSVREFKPGMKLLDYNDDGKAIYACWQTPDLYGNDFYRNKTFRRLYAELAAWPATGLTVYGRVEGVWRRLFQDESTPRYFSYANITYSKFTYSTDETNRTIGGKIRVKKVDKTSFRLENGQLNEPFGVNAIGIEFVETSHFRP